EVWDGSRWLVGAKAIAYLLALEGDPVGLVPESPPADPAPPPRRALRVRAGGGGQGNLSARIAAYAGRLPHPREGQGRTRVAFAFAAWLVRDLALADALALDWLERWDGGNSPPLGRGRLSEIVADAHGYGTAAYGCGLPPAGPRRDRH